MSLLVSNMTRDTMAQIHLLGYTVSVAMVSSRWTAVAKNDETGRSHVVNAETQELVMAGLAAKVWTDHLQTKTKTQAGRAPFIPPVVHCWDRGFVV